MITPSKFISFKDSSIGKLSFLIVGAEQIAIRDLYHEVEEKFDGVEDFMCALDVLYILNKITIDFERGIISYVG
jgi:hypothetical protein